jgi:hypothetical protein
MCCDDCCLLPKVTYTCGVKGPMQRVGGKGILTTRAGQRGGKPHGAVQHRNGTGLVGHSRLWKQQSLSQLSHSVTFTVILLNSLFIIVNKTITVCCVHWKKKKKYERDVRCAVVLRLLAQRWTLLTVQTGSDDKLGQRPKKLRIRLTRRQWLRLERKKDNWLLGEKFGQAKIHAADPSHLRTKKLRRILLESKGLRKERQIQGRESIAAANKDTCVSRRQLSGYQSYNKLPSPSPP